MTCAGEANASGMAVLTGRRELGGKDSNPQ
jgi:hypothetical protein